MIRLTRLRVQSLINPHGDLPKGMEMIAQGIVDLQILKQTEAMPAETSGDAWTLELDWNIPPDASVFLVAIVRKYMGIRLLGSVEVQRPDALASAEQNTPLCLKLKMVNHDGPTLECTSWFSVAETNAELDEQNVADVAPIKLNFSGYEMDPTQPPKPWMFHESVLLELNEAPGHLQLRAAMLSFFGALWSTGWSPGDKTTQIMDSLNQAVCAHRDAVRDDPGNATYLTDTAEALYARFQCLGDLADLDESVAMSTQALELSPNDRSSVLETLAKSLMDRFIRHGSLDDLEKINSVYRQQILLLPDNHTDAAGHLHNLGMAVHLRFQEFGNVGDINEAVSILTDAVNRIPGEHSFRTTILSNLGICLLERFWHLGDRADLNHSVLRLRQATALSSTGETKIDSSVSLARGLLARFNRIGNIEDINESVVIMWGVIGVTPNEDIRKPSYLSFLGNALDSRFLRLDDLGDIDAAVWAFKQAVSLLPNDHSHRVSPLHGLGRCLRHRFQNLHSLADLDEAVVSVLEDAIAVCPDHGTRKYSLLLDLAQSLVDRRHTNSSNGTNDADYVRARDTYARIACSTTSLTTSRFKAAVQWAEMVPPAQHFIDSLPSVMPAGGPSAWVAAQSLQAYSTALNLLPEISWLGLSISDRHYQISDAGEVVRNAVSSAITAREYGKAVEWVEQGRSIVWGQMLELRTPVDALNRTHPVLADRLVALSAQLESAAYRETIIQAPVMDAWDSIGMRESLSQSHHEAAHARTALLKEIRALDNFDKFLLPRTMSELSVAADHGHVVILSTSGIHWSGCHALVLRPGLSEDVVLHIPLPKFEMSNAVDLGKSLDNLLREAGVGGRLEGKREGAVDSEVEFAHILSELWTRIAKPVLDGLGWLATPSRDTSRRIWWCPTGPLTYLPIHAAGLYGENDSLGCKLSDFVISSYTPSLTALIHGFRKKPNPQDEIRVLAVAQPSAKDQHYIPGTRAELEAIQRLAREAQNIPVLRLEGKYATVESVQKEMKGSSWVHFACHGVQDADTPTESALLVDPSSRLTLSDITKMSLPHADLAFLSACQTATGARDLQEESVHLAAGMLLAGYRSVIGTMWSIMDNDASKVAPDVYEHLFKTSPPDAAQAAEALHLAVRKLREGPGKKSFFHWVPFIHLGV